MARIPSYQPQLAQLVKSPPDGAEWIHELKYDGYRIGCRIDGKSVALISRNGKDWTHAFPAIVKAAGRLDVTSALLDGEVCVVLPDGRTSFQALQNVSHSNGTLVYIVFDLLYLNGRSFLREPLHARKAALKKILRGPHIQFAAHIDGSGADAFREACRLRAEGIVSKLRDQPYMSGKRTGWVKTKCIQRQEFVIGGFTDPEGSRTGIGALLVGYYDGNRLAFAGKVGTGFTAKSAADLRRTLDRIEIDKSPFTPAPPGWLGRHAHWVTPTLVGEVAFTEWTGDGNLRHPSFQGLRADKSPRAIVREQAEAAASAAPVVLGVTISHPERVMYPKPRLTKLDVARYYGEVAARMLPHVEGRPLTLVRCGSGIGGDCIFMKHSKVWAPPQLKRVRIQEKTKLGEYLVIESPEAIVALAQMDILEIHTWNTREDKVELPDRIVIDLDPGRQVRWPAVIDAARLVRGVLHTLGLESWLKTTGGRGLHVVVPITRTRLWSECLEFARSIGDALVRHDPKRFTIQFGKRGRERQILIDYLRNNRTNTSIAAFSTRARPGAPVSLPIDWADLDESLDPASFTVATVPARLAAQRKDPWAAYFRTRQSITSRALEALQGLHVT
jgi:bifunctional non-homologous end joining protein LigD